MAAACSRADRFAAEGAERAVAEAARQLDALVPTEIVRAGLAAHAPYSVAPLMFRAIRAAARRDPLAPCSVHLSESAEEVEFIRTGSGPWRAFLEDVKAWDPGWIAPGGSRCNSGTRFLVPACWRCTAPDDAGT
jgi:cytosine/adenosine deaminase-related metal-dependent hydrolase